MLDWRGPGPGPGPVLSLVTTGLGPGSGQLWSNIAKVWSRSIFLTGLDPCTAFAQDT